VAINFFTFWFITHEKSKTLFVLVFEAPLMFFAVWGIVAAYRRGWTLLEKHMLLMMGALYAIYIAILSDARYFHLFLPFVCYFSCLGLQAAAEKFAARREIR
jgi:hypothetical protein